ncbi:MAG: cytochrome c-type biogenesis protein CcmH, partial [Planctomycetota bacterium]
MPSAGADAIDHLLKPPFNTHTLLLWGSPFLLCLFGFYIFWRAANA